MTDKERLEEIKEEWKDIKGYEGCYQVSNKGAVKSFKHNKKGRNLTPKFNGHYNQIRLCREGVCKIHSIHRLVATHFVKNTFGKEQVNHIDGDKTNNFYKNLEWVTRSENGSHAYRTRLRESQKGENHGMSKLTEKEVLSIYFLSHTGRFEQKEIAEMFNIHLATVSDIKLKKRWRHVTNAIEQAERVQELEDIIYQDARQEVLEGLYEENKRYREALEFYADRKTYERRHDPYEPLDTDINDDCGHKARKALEELK